MVICVSVTGVTWTDYVKEWSDFQGKNPSYPLLNLCYEDMKRVTNHIANE
jgi:hypothetical protein